MRIAAVVGVRDEAELIAPLLDHLSAIGVSQFVVCDVSSTDGTREILRRHETQGVQVQDIAIDEPQEAWRQRTADTIRSLDADWVLPIDADEFPLPAGGDLRPLLAEAEADVLFLPRFNVVVGEAGLRMPLPCEPACYGDVDLFTAPAPDARSRMESGLPHAWIRFVPKPKIAVRPSAVMSVRDAVHDIVPHPVASPVRQTSNNIIMAHVALSSYPRFARKVQNIRELFGIYSDTLNPGFGWHWKRWLELADRGELEAEYQVSSLGASDIAALRAEGKIRSAAEILNAMQAV